MKLFRKNIDPRCAYCQRGQQISETDVMCVKHGIVPVEHHCRGFHYDPLKRVPPRPASLDTAKLKEEDFSCEFQRFPSSPGTPAGSVHPLRAPPPTMIVSVISAHCSTLLFPAYFPKSAAALLLTPLSADVFGTS